MRKKKKFIEKSVKGKDKEEKKKKQQHEVFFKCFRRKIFPQVTILF